MVSLALWVLLLKEMLLMEIFCNPEGQVQGLAWHGGISLSFPT
jgi:hypothetical protein